MRFGELIYSLITLLLMFLVIFSPLIKKILKGRDSSNSGSVHKTFRDKGKSNNDSELKNEIKRIQREEPTIRQVKFVEPDFIKFENEVRLKKIDRIKALHEAIIWKEILSPPVALRDLGDDDYL